MGALPSRESHEGPNTVYFGNNTGVVTFRLPLTPHYFPSADCLAFKEVHRVRDSQSCKYSFNIREASAVLPEALAKELKASQEEYWGPEAEAADPSLFYNDEEIQTRLVENGFSRTEKLRAHHHDHSSSGKRNQHQHIRPPVEGRKELYQKLVVEPTANALVDTDDEMRELFMAEKRWRAAREVVRRHRAFLKQQHLNELEKSQLDSRELVQEDVPAAELEAAEAVPPPQMWLRPIPEVVVERMSMEDACAAHRAYHDRHREASTGAASATAESRASREAPADRRDMRCNLGRGPASADYNHKSDEVALSVLDETGRRPFVENDTLNEEMLKSYPSFQDDHLPFEMDEQYMDGRVHMVAYEGVNYLFAYNPAYLRAMGKTVVVDGSLVEERRRTSGAAQSPHCRRAFTTTYTVATRQADDFDDPNQRRAYEIFQPIYERYYIPVMPVRILGVDGFIPCNVDDEENDDDKEGEEKVRQAGHNNGHDMHQAEAEAEAGGEEDGRGVTQHKQQHQKQQHRSLRGAAWMRGVALDEAEEYYEERTLLQKYGVAPPPVLRACRFVHAVIGDKILNRMSVLGCMTFRERCINAGLPDAIACPLWSVMEVSDIPQLQFQREIELRLLAAMHEIDDGDMRIRNALARQHQWNDYIDFTNSPKYGFMVSAPPERRFRVDADGKLREVGTADGAERDDDETSSSSGNEREKDEEHPRARAANHQNGKSSSKGKNGGGAAGASPSQSKSSTTESSAQNEEASTAAVAKAAAPVEGTKTLCSSSGATQTSVGSSGSGGLSGKANNAQPALALTLSKAPAKATTATTATTAGSSNPGSDTESRDEHSGSTSARSAAHNTSVVFADHSGSKADLGSSSTIQTNNGSHNTYSEQSGQMNTSATSLAGHGKSDGGAARVKRSRDGQSCIGGCAPPETAEQTEALTSAMINAGMSKSCVEAVVTPEEDMECFAEPPPADLCCAWSFKRRRLGITEEVLVNPNFSEEEWMPMVNPLTKDAALALLGIRVSTRGRVALVRYSGAAVQKVLYYLSQASAPIFCLPYVGPPQQCPNVYFENVVRVPRGLELTAAPQNGLQPPTAQQIENALSAYAEGKVSCYVFVDLNDHAANPPTSCVRNHRRDDALLGEAVEAGITSKLILAQMPIKADARCALEWYRKTLSTGPAPRPSAADPAGSPYAHWPALLDAPAPCDGDVLVVCPRTHRWIRITTLILTSALLLVHKRLREKADELAEPAPVLELYGDENFAAEVEVCYEGLTHKNMDSEGMQCHMLHMRNFFSYNGIVELVLDRLRTIVDQERYEDKDDEGWLVLHEPPCATPPSSSSLVSSPTTATNSTVATSTTSSSRLNYGLPNSGAAAFTSQKYVESGSYFIWSFALAGQRYFFGTKPRFIRLALQRQKQNQRRRQKRKEREALGAATTATATATNNNNNNNNNNNSASSRANGKLSNQSNKRGTPDSADLTASTLTTSSTPTTTSAAVTSPNVRHPTTQSESSFGSSGGSLSNGGQPVYSNNTDGQQHPHRASPMAFATPTVWNAIADNASATAGSARMPITAADSVHLAHDAVHHNSNNSDNNSTPHYHHVQNASQVAQPMPPPSAFAQQHSSSAVQQQQQQQQQRPGTVGSAHHAPYAPLHVTAQDRLCTDECNEMREIRHRHRLWLTSHGVCYAENAGQPHHIGGSTTSRNLSHETILSPNNASQLPRSLNLDTAGLELPPLAGQQTCRRRLVVPIGPFGFGQPRIVNCEDVQRGVDGIADAFRGVTGGAAAAPPLSPQREARASDLENEEAPNADITATQQQQQQRAVPVQKSGSPRVMDAERTSYRWNPYRVGN